MKFWRPRIPPNSKSSKCPWLLENAYQMYVLNRAVIWVLSLTFLSYRSLMSHACPIAFPGGCWCLHLLGSSPEGQPTFFNSPAIFGRAQLWNYSTSYQRPQTTLILWYPSSFEIHTQVNVIKYSGLYFKILLLQNSWCVRPCYARSIY